MKAYAAAWHAQPVLGAYTQTSAFRTLSLQIGALKTFTG